MGQSVCKTVREWEGVNDDGLGGRADWHSSTCLLESFEQDQTNGMEEKGRSAHIDKTPIEYYTLPLPNRERHTTSLKNGRVNH